MIEGTDYINVASEDFNKIVNHSGVYALSPEMMYKNGIIKIGICQNLLHRISFYRSAYGWITQLFIFGLIIIEDKKEMRRIEKEIFTKLKDIRIGFTPFRGKTAKTDSEWCVIDTKIIKKIFNEHKKQGYQVITAFNGLDTAPLPDLHTKVIKKLPRGKYLVEFPTGEEASIDGNILRKSVNIPPLKWSDPELLEWITQGEADAILHGIVKNNSRVEINRHGGLINYFDESLMNLVRKRKREGRRLR